MFDLDAAVRNWRKDLAAEGTLSKSDLDELEDHLLLAYQADVDTGLQPASAFDNARGDVGAIAELTAEFEKLDSGSWRQFLSAGWAMFVLAFFLPVHDAGIAWFGSGSGADAGTFPGFEAFYYAITGELGFIGFLSALTNALMGLTLLRSADNDRCNVFVLAGILVAATFLNLYWMVDGLADLRIGYFMWLTSFASVAAGYLVRARELSDKPVTVPSI
jgi:hypothetical protein